MRRFRVLEWQPCLPFVPHTSYLWFALSPLPFADCQFVRVTRVMPRSSPAMHLPDFLKSAWGLGISTYDVSCSLLPEQKIQPQPQACQPVSCALRGADDWRIMNGGEDSSMPSGVERSLHPVSDVRFRPHWPKHWLAASRRHRYSRETFQRLQHQMLC